MVERELPIILYLLISAAALLVVVRNDNRKTMFALLHLFFLIGYTIGKVMIGGEIHREFLGRALPLVVPGVCLSYAVSFISIEVPKRLKKDLKNIPELFRESVFHYWTTVSLLILVFTS